MQEGRDAQGRISTPSVWKPGPRRLSNNTSINNADTIDSIKRMASNVWREMESMYEEAPGWFVAGQFEGTTFHRRLVLLAEHVANLNMRIQNELV